MEFYLNLFGVLVALSNFLKFGNSTVISELEQCGQRLVLSGTIFGGAPTKKGDWPWLVAFVYWPDEAFFCAGSLITRSHVLTGKCFNFSTTYL